MTEPKRWRDDPAANAELRALLESLPASSGLPSAVFSHVRSRLDGALSGTSPEVPDPCAGALGGAKTAPLLGLGLKLGAGALIAGGAALGLLAKSALPLQEVPALRSSTLSTPPPRSTAVALPRPTAAQTFEPAASAAHNAVAVRPPARALPETAARKGRAPSLREETELLERVRAALARDPHEAERRLLEYDARVRTPQLEVERKLLEIEVLAQLGQRALARAQAERTLRAYPTSVYAARLTALLGELARDPTNEGKPSPAQSVGSRER